MLTQYKRSDLMDKENLPLFEIGDIVACSYYLDNPEAKIIARYPTQSSDKRHTYNLEFLDKSRGHGIYNEKYLALRKRKGEEKFDLCAILASCVGERFFSLAYGEMEVVKVTETGITAAQGVDTFGFTQKGSFMYSEGVCMLYPSAEHYQRYGSDFIKAWREWETERLPKCWRAQEGETYSYIDRRLLVKSAQETASNFDDANYRNGNYFRTESDATAATKIVRNTLLSLHKEDQHDNKQ